MEEKLPNNIDNLLKNRKFEAPEGYYSKMQKEVLSRHEKPNTRTFYMRRIMAVAAGLALIVFAFFQVADNNNQEYLLTDIDNEILLEYLIEEGEIDDILDVEGDDIPSLDEVLNWN